VLLIEFLTVVVKMQWLLIVRLGSNYQQNFWSELTHHGQSSQVTTWQLRCHTCTCHDYHTIAVRWHACSLFSSESEVFFES
jgi:hypothetical protein